MPELRQFEIGISTRRYLPAMGTAGLERFAVSGYNLVPAPPPKITERICLLIIYVDWLVYFCLTFLSADFQVLVHFKIQLRLFYKIFIPNVVTTIDLPLHTLQDLEILIGPSRLPGKKAIFSQPLLIQLLPLFPLFIYSSVVNVRLLRSFDNSNICK